MFCRVSISTRRCLVSAVFFTLVALPLPHAQSQSNEDSNPLLEQEQPRLELSGGATLIGLNKRSGQAKKIRVIAGRSTQFETLTIRLVSCTRITYPMHDDFTALLKIYERKEGVLFQGWMYAEYPSLNAMEHPIYDVWVKSCLPQ